MFSIDFLHRLREAELAVVVRRLRPGARILEIGGGTGHQARLLSSRGFAVASVDLAASAYTAHRVFPVQDYDGERLPYPSASFDAVFSSNVLEHVAAPAPLHREMRRVLRPGGECLHILPSPSWRLWSSLTHYLDVPVLALRRNRASHPLLRPDAPKRSPLHLLRRALWAPRHGEVGNALTELYHFSRRRWLRHFREHGFLPVAVEPVGLFYTSSMALGPRLSLARRRHLARWLGSSTMLYVLTVPPDAGGSEAG